MAVQPMPVKTIAADKLWKERARKQPQGQLPHAQAPRRRLTTKREGLAGGTRRQCLVRNGTGMTHELPYGAYLSTRSAWRERRSSGRAGKFTTCSTWTRKEQETHRQQQAKRASPTAGSRTFPTAGKKSMLKCRDALRRRRISFQPTNASKKARTEVHVHHTSPANLENPDAMTQLLAAEALSRAGSLLFDARDRRRKNGRSASPIWSAGRDIVPGSGTCAGRDVRDSSGNT